MAPQQPLLTLRDLERELTRAAQLEALAHFWRQPAESQQQRAARLKFSPATPRGGHLRPLMIPPPGVTGRAAQGYRDTMLNILAAYLQITKASGFTDSQGRAWLEILTRAANQLRAEPTNRPPVQALVSQVVAALHREGLTQQ